MEILFVGYRDDKHSKFGGYDRIIDFPNSSYLNASNLPFGFFKPGQRGKGLNIYFVEKAVRKRRFNFNIIHYFYGDAFINYKLPTKKTSKFVTTVHLKMNNLTDGQLNNLRAYDKVISLSSAQAEELNNKRINAHFIPHGFDSPIFENKSGLVNNDKINIFYSGINYRDFQTFKKIVSYCLSERKDVLFHALGQPKKNQEELSNYNNTIVYQYIDDDEYYSLLSQCDYNFLPLLFATANNALLEAQSIGVKSILPKLNGISDYACKQENLYYENLDSLYTLFDKIKKEKKSKHLVNFSKKYEWKNIYEELNELYLTL